jgi:hypothetical protein
MDPAEVETLEGSVVDVETRRPLGFMFIGAQATAGMLVVRFGFHLPMGRKIAVRLDRVYLRDGVESGLSDGILVESSLSD